MANTFASPSSHPRLCALHPRTDLPTMRLIAQQFGADPKSSLEIISPEAFEEHGSALIRHMKVVNLRYGYERL